MSKHCMCPGCGENPNGNINQFVRETIERKGVEEALKEIQIHFKVEVKRWNQKTKCYGKWKLHYNSKKVLLNDLLTKGGRDLIHNASFLTGAQPAALTYYAICNPATFSPADTDTTLNTEITTPSGLARHVCNGVVDGVTESFTHTAGLNTTVVACGFQNNSGGAISGLNSSGQLQSAVAGTLGSESAFQSLDLNANA